MNLNRRAAREKAVKCFQASLLIQKQQA